MKDWLNLGSNVHKKILCSKFFKQYSYVKNETQWNKILYFYQNSKVQIARQNKSGSGPDYTFHFSVDTVSERTLLIFENNTAPTWP